MEDKSKHGTGKKLATVTVKRKDGTTFERKQMVGRKEGEAAKEKTSSKPEEKTGAHSPEKLADFAKNASREALEAKIKTSGDASIRSAASAELKRRDKEESGEKGKKSAESSSSSKSPEKVKVKTKDGSQKEMSVKRSIKGGEKGGIASKKPSIFNKNLEQQFNGDSLSDADLTEIFEGEAATKIRSFFGKDSEILQENQDGSDNPEVFEKRFERLVKNAKLIGKEKFDNGVQVSTYEAPNGEKFATTSMDFGGGGSPDMIIYAKKQAKSEGSSSGTGSESLKIDHKKFASEDPRVKQILKEIVSTDSPKSLTNKVEFGSEETKKAALAEIDRRLAGGKQLEPEKKAKQKLPKDAGIFDMTEDGQFSSDYFLAGLSAKEDKTKQLGGEFKKGIIALRGSMDEKKFRKLASMSEAGSVRGASFGDINSALDNPKSLMVVQELSEIAGIVNAKSIDEYKQMTYGGSLLSSKPKAEVEKILSGSPEERKEALNEYLESSMNSIKRHQSESSPNYKFMKFVKDNFSISDFTTSDSKIEKSEESDFEKSEHGEGKKIAMVTVKKKDGSTFQRKQLVGTKKKEAITAQGVLRKLREYESGYHGRKTGSEALGMDGAEPDEFHFRKKYGSKDISENEKKIIKEKLSVSDKDIRFKGSNFYLKGYKRAEESSDKKDSKSELKVGDTVSLNSDVNLISLSNLKGQKLEVLGYVKTGLISSPEFVKVRDENGEEHELNPEYVSKKNASKDSKSDLYEKFEAESGGKFDNEEDYEAAFDKWLKSKSKLKVGTKVSFTNHKGKKEEGEITHVYPDGQVDIKDSKDSIAKFKPENILGESRKEEGVLTKEILDIAREAYKNYEPKDHLFEIEKLKEAISKKRDWVFDLELKKHEALLKEKEVSKDKSTPTGKKTYEKTGEKYLEHKDDSGKILFKKGDKVTFKNASGAEVEGEIKHFNKNKHAPKGYAFIKGTDGKIYERTINKINSK